MNPAPRPRPRGRITGPALLALALLLILPALAIRQLCPPFDFRIVLAYFLSLGALTYAFYADDKRRAETGRWRVSEATLHFAEIAGGWPGAFLAQRRLRHKTSKRSYQEAFWSIVSFINTSRSTSSSAGVSPAPPAPPSTASSRKCHPAHSALSNSRAVRRG